MLTTYSYNEMVETLAKPRMYVRSLQKKLDLYIPKGSKARYSQAYVRFLQKVIALRTFSVSLEKIVDIFEMEKKILVLLHIDTLTDSPTWYLDACENDGTLEQALLLTGYNIGFPLTATAVQAHLNFGVKDAELFTNREMGVDIRDVLRKYTEKVEVIQAIVRKETPVLERALFWADDTFR